MPATDKNRGQGEFSTNWRPACWTPKAVFTVRWAAVSLVGCLSRCFRADTLKYGPAALANSERLHEHHKVQVSGLQQLTGSEQSCCRLGLLPADAGATPLFHMLPVVNLPGVIMITSAVEQSIQAMLAGSSASMAFLS